MVLDLFAPHTAEEMWEVLGYEPFVGLVPWRKADPTLLVEDTVKAVVQIDGKVRATLDVSARIDAAAARALARADERVHAGARRARDQPRRSCVRRRSSASPRAEPPPQAARRRGRPRVLRSDLSAPATLPSVGRVTSADDPPAAAGRASAGARRGGRRRARGARGHRRHRHPARGLGSGREVVAMGARDGGCRGAGRALRPRVRCRGGARACTCSTVGARVVDAVAAAGGFAPDADEERGEPRPAAERRRAAAVPVAGAAPAAGTGAAAGDGRVNLNTADADALDTLPRIGARHGRADHRVARGQRRLHQRRGPPRGARDRRQDARSRSATW